MPGQDVWVKPEHVAIIMDGNGRWATARGLPRSAGHKAGVEALQRAVRAVGDRGIPWLTLYAFSSENWSRPKSEVSDLMGLLKFFIRRDLAELHRNGVRVRILGEREGLQKDIGALLREAEALTRANTRMNLQIAFNYGARDEIVRAARKAIAAAQAGEFDRLDEAVFASMLDTADAPDPDLVIRTGGDQRLSNFLLWQAAYAELVFLDCRWPDFGEAELDAALAQFGSRQRRFGGVVARDAS
ncbi:MAG: isoprenyl transferase [Rhizobiaceae bacterium]|nr:isoprenyl transferase [Rhizobiaceae bacterium]